MKYSYGFLRATGQCQFRADGPVERSEGITVVQSDMCYELDDICLKIDPVHGVSITPVYKSAEDAIADLKRERERLYAIATNRLSILCEVIRRSTVKEAVERAKIEEEEWQSYRVKLYELDLSLLDDVEWPPQPNVQ